MTQAQLLPSVRHKAEALVAQFGEIPEPRKEILDQLAQAILDHKNKALPLRLQFICTHNSRRSQLAQVWAQTAADYFAADNVETFSSGTEVTAFNPRAVRALERAGFKIEVTSDDEKNPRYHIRYASTAPALVCFSKCYDDPCNPSADFVAVMTCSDADQNCPAVPGARKLALLYQDPKVADDTALEASTYDERSDQIGRELLWVFHRVFTP